MAAKHPDIRVTLDAASDDFRIIDHVIKAMRRAGIPRRKLKYIWGRCAARNEGGNEPDPVGDNEIEHDTLLFY
jgi:hypothetical protein